MNGIHDLGGMHGMGPIEINANEPIFEHDWERRVFAMFIAAFASGMFNVDEFRHSIEVMKPAEYLETTYYEHWLHALEKLSTDAGVLTMSEIQDRVNQLKGAH